MGTSSVATLERPHDRAVVCPLALVSPLAEVPPPPQPRSADLLWRVWPGREWPASGDEERAFLADLEHRVQANGSFDQIEPRRGDMTALLNALRCGLEAPDLFSRAPGLRPDRLIVAHMELDARRRGAVSAWRVIASRPTAESLATWGDTAAALVPVVIGRLRDVPDVDAAGLESLVAACAADIDRVGRLAASVERDMSDPGVPPRRRAGLAGLLYGGAGAGLWHHECFIAQRVGSLVPVRVAALLGENVAR
jgi:hypothetical protein